MAWTTWDHYRAPTTWHREVGHPLDRFIHHVDRMFYASAAALAIAVVLLLVG